MTFKRGDIVLVYFPHADLRTIELRPALVVQENNLQTGIAQVIVAMISSNLNRADHPSRITILLSDELATGTGLRLDSVIMTDNLATIEFVQFRTKIGSFSKMTLVDKALRNTLGL